MSGPSPTRPRSSPPPARASAAPPRSPLPPRAHASSPPILTKRRFRPIASDSIHTARLDVLNAAAIAQAARDAGPIEILFNCAGLVHQGTLLDANQDEWSLAFDLNVRSMFRTMQAFVPAMLAARRRRDPEHGVGGEQPEGRAEPLHLQRHQGGGDRHDEVGGGRLRQAGHTLQLSVPRHSPDAKPGGADRGERGSGGIGTRQHVGRSSIVNRWGALVHRRRSPNSRCTSRPTPHSSSPARLS